MARTAIAVTTVGFQGKIDNLTFTAADAVNGMMFDNDAQTVVVIKNTGAGVVNVTVTSVADEAGRTGNLVVAVPATTGIGFISLLRALWWNQRTSDVGKVYLDFSTASGVSVAVLKLQP